MIELKEYNVEVECFVHHHELVMFVNYYEDNEKVFLVKKTVDLRRNRYVLHDAGVRVVNALLTIIDVNNLSYDDESLGRTIVKLMVQLDVIEAIEYQDSLNNNKQ